MRKREMFIEMKTKSVKNLETEKRSEKWTEVKGKRIDWDTKNEITRKQNWTRRNDEDKKRNSYADFHERNHELYAITFHFKLKGPTGKNKDFQGCSRKPLSVYLTEIWLYSTLCKQKSNVYRRYLPHTEGVLVPSLQKAAWVHVFDHEIQDPSTHWYLVWHGFAEKLIM